MSGLLTVGTFNRFDMAAKAVAGLVSPAQRSGAGNSLTERETVIGSKDGNSDVYPHGFDVCLSDGSGNEGVWVFLSTALTDRFYDLSQDVATPTGYDANHQEFPTGSWCRAFGSRFDGEVAVSTDVYFVADFSASDSVPFAFVLLPEGTELSVPPFVRANLVAHITADGETQQVDQLGLSFERPDPGSQQCVIGYGLRLTADDLGAPIAHAICSAVDDESAAATGVLTKILHNSDVRTFLYTGGGLLNGLSGYAWGMLVTPSAVSERGVTYAIDTESDVLEDAQDFASLNSNWLSLAAIAANETRITLRSYMPEWGICVHSGYKNERPYKAFLMTGNGGLSLEYERNASATFVYSLGQIGDTGTLALTKLPVGTLTGYVVQYNFRGGVVFTASEPEPPAEGSLFPSLRLTVTLAPVDYASMEFFRDFVLLAAESMGWPTPDTPLDPTAIDIAVCTQEGDSLDLNDNAIQTTHKFPTCDNETGKLSGCAFNLRLPVVDAPDTAVLGVSYVLDVETGDRTTGLQGVTEEPAASAQQRVYAHASDGAWGLLELVKWFGLDAENRKLTCDPKAFNGTKKTLTHDAPSATWDFATDTPANDGVTIRIQTHEEWNTTSNKLIRYYRDITLPAIFVSAIGAETAVDVIAGENCP